MPLTLEAHFKELLEQDPSVEHVHSLFVLLKNDLEKELQNTKYVFVNYSLHDGSHSRAIIHAIERFLGEERIHSLSATDTFMLLVCAYAHDYGMAQTCNKVYRLMDSPGFKRFLESQEKDSSTMETEDTLAIKNLLWYLNDSKPNIPLNEFYHSIQLVLQLFLRPNHWKGVLDIRKDFQGLFEKHLDGRFISGSEGIVEICMCHGMEFESLMQLKPHADGIIGDDFHPRLIAAMIRLGDLLDLDNNRFPAWFTKEAARDDTIIPRLSVLHSLKHAAISHLLVTENKIEIQACCHSSQSGYEVANLVSQWTGWLKDECRNLQLHWNEISQNQFGPAPATPDIQIFVDGKPYTAADKNLKMQMSQERVMNLLKGTSIYRDKYVGIRELLQNAVDATALQLWNDIKWNRYLAHGLSKDHASPKLDLMDIIRNGWNSIFSNYDITVELIKDLQKNQVILVVKDKGIGITREDVEFISDIGSSKEKNMRIRSLMSGMPAWLKPAGIFGIGLQSVFQLTDCIEFYTRQHNQPELLISLHSYGKSKGKIEICEVPPNHDGLLFYDNAIPGTNVKIVIDPAKIMCADNREDQHENFIYYDPEFDLGNELNIIYAELCQVCKERLQSTHCDYFNVRYREITTDKSGNSTTAKDIYLRRSYFTPSKPGNTKSLPAFHNETIAPFITSKGTPFHFTDSTAYYWDAAACRCYSLKVRPCSIIDKGKNNQVFLPETTESLYHVSYKFNEISNTETIYPDRNRFRRAHAGFLSWNILILDDTPTKYLNIDRERLRDGAISEAELLEVRKKILLEWLNYFLSTGKNKTAGSKNPAKDRFANTPGILLSLILLFFQNVPAGQFSSFMSLHQDYVVSLGLTVGKEKIPFPFFWDKNNLFQTTCSFPDKTNSAPPNPSDLTNDSDGSDGSPLSISIETLRHFPRRIVRIESIQGTDDGRLLYHFRFDASGNIPFIALDDTARFYDYALSLEAQSNQPTKVDYSSIMKKVFKPDSKYPHLALPRYPYTFSQGGNFYACPDHCIRWYILSPLDKDATNLLRKAIRDDLPENDEFLNYVGNSKQFDKCVEYVRKIRFSTDSNPDNIRQIVRNEYEMFVSELYRILYQNRDAIQHWFSSKRTS